MSLKKLKMVMVPCALLEEKIVTYHTLTMNIRRISSRLGYEVHPRDRDAIIADSKLKLIYKAIDLYASWVFN